MFLKHPPKCNAGYIKDPDVNTKKKGMDSSEYDFKVNMNK
jgi:hypothetical protein